MDKPTSVLLDLFRFMAALAVMIQHVEQITKNYYLSFLGSFGHDAVLFFFILSGYVIAYVSAEKEHSFKFYISSRLIRLYSVALPALFFSIALWFLAVVVLNFDGVLYKEDYDLSRVLVGSVLFLNESWGLGQNFPTLGTYWSINYEFWYYFLFGLAFYLKGFRRLLLISFFAVLAGPGVLLLFPIWVAGYFLYKYPNMSKFNIPSSVIVFIFSVFSYAFIRLNNFDDELYFWFAGYFGGDSVLNRSLGYGKRFLSDYLLSLLQILFLISIISLKDFLHVFLKPFCVPIRYLASLTFAIYLFHYPIIIFIVNFSTNIFGLFFISFALIVPIFYFTEYVRDFFKKLLRLKY